MVQVIDNGATLLNPTANDNGAFAEVSQFNNLVSIKVVNVDQFSATTGVGVDAAAMKALIKELHDIAMNVFDPADYDITVLD